MNKSTIVTDGYEAECLAQFACCDLQNANMSISQ